MKSPIHKKVKIDHTLAPVPVGNSILLATDIELGNAPALCERIVAPAPASTTERVRLRNKVRTSDITRRVGARPMTGRYRLHDQET